MQKKYRAEEFESLLLETVDALQEYIEEREEDGDVCEDHAEGWSMALDQVVISLLGRKSQENYLEKELESV